MDHLAAGVGRGGEVHSASPSSQGGEPPAHLPGISAEHERAGYDPVRPGGVDQGAVGMVEMALQMLSHQNIVELVNDKKAAMVSNLRVVLCSDRGTKPIV